MKRKQIKSLILSRNFSFCMFQETKCVNLDPLVLRSLVGNQGWEWVAKPSVGLLGGFLWVWRSDEFSLVNSFGGERDLSESLFGITTL